MNTLEHFESELRRYCAEHNSPISIDTAHILGNRIGIEEEERVRLLKHLHKSDYIFIISSNVLPNFLKTANITESNIRHCVLELKRRGIENPTPNEMLNEYTIIFGRPDNAETFMRLIRAERESLREVKTLFHPKHETQTTLL